jgi:hypothetical protein
MAIKEKKNNHEHNMQYLWGMTKRPHQARHGGTFL